jgi:thiamine transport system substrate-binding protein
MNRAQGRRNGVRVALAIVAAVAVGAASCSRGAPGPEGSVTVTLLTHDSFDVSEAVVDRFERASGIDLRIVPAGDAGQLLNRAILAAGNPEGDVLFGIDDSQFPQALEAGVFEAYRSPALDQVDPRFLLDPTDQVSPIDHGAVCLNYDRAWFADRDLAPPRDLAELTSPAYRGLTVVENPTTSSPGLAFLMATIARFGDPGWERYWQGLVDNDVLVVDGWEQAYEGQFSGAGGGEGDRPIVVSYATSPVAEVVFADEPLDRAPTGVVDEGCYRQVEFAGVLAGTDHPDEARRVVDFLLSRSFQEDVPLRMFVFPVLEDAVLPTVFERFGREPDPTLSLPPDEVVADRAEWVERWTDLVLR